MLLGINISTKLKIGKCRNYSAWTNRSKLSFYNVRCSYTVQRWYQMKTLGLEVPNKFKKEEVMPETFQSDKVEREWEAWWAKNNLYTQSSNLTLNPLPDSDPMDQNAFSMLSPPPNITGKLHLGHALTYTIQDMFARYHRMCGKHVQWIPGFDHAGIGTQAVVEKHLMKENITKHQLGDEAFREKIWEFTNLHKNLIENQVRRIGASLDWDKCFFTLDEKRSEFVKKAFIKLYEEGLIYRDTRLVNWSCSIESVISDLEVEEEVIDKPTFLKVPNLNEKVEFGVLYQIPYRLFDSDKYITVVTSRPETILADIALAVHSKDDRYKDLIGKYVHHPILKDKLLPIIIDDELVDPEFGSGVVKITPAHDKNDYKAYLKLLKEYPNQQWNKIDIFNSKGYIEYNLNWPQYSGLHRYECRNQIIKDLKNLGLNIIKIPSPTNTIIPRCSRTNDIIEMKLKPQWYIKMNEMAEQAKQLVLDKEVQILPQQFEKDWFRWLDNIQDWCISRQLVWGHSIPMYQIDVNDNIKLDELEKQWLKFIQLEDNNNNNNNCYKWYIGNDEIDLKNRLKKLIILNFYNNNISNNDELLLKLNQFLLKLKFKQDKDVLDTWFSSALLPLSVLNNNNNNNNYPTNLLETGSDILFFWVARMVMLCNYLSNKLTTFNGPPFKKVMLHPMIRDKFGRKMSKSLGNVIDPIHIMDGITLNELKLPIQLANHLSNNEKEISLKGLINEFPNGIKKCGTDALRFTLINYLQQGKQINMNLDNIISNSYFGNKLWNLIRYYLNKEQDYLKTKGNSSNLININLNNLTLLKTNQLNLPERYMLSKLNNLIIQYHKNMLNYELSKNTIQIKNFIINLICDIIIEFNKLTYKRDFNNNNNNNNLISIENSLISLKLTINLILKLLHPIMPFITEELWIYFHSMKPNKPLIIEEMPLPEQLKEFNDPLAEIEMENLIQLIHGARSLRQSHHLKITELLSFQLLIEYDPNYPKENLHFWLNSNSQLNLNLDLICKIANMKSLIINSKPSLNRNQIQSGFFTHIIKQTSYFTITLITPVSTTSEHYNLNSIKIQQQKQSNKLLNLLNQQNKLIESIKDPNYLSRVPQRIKDVNQLKLKSLDHEIKILQSSLKEMNNLINNNNN